MMMNALGGAQPQQPQPQPQMSGGPAGGAVRHLASGVDVEKAHEELKAQWDKMNAGKKKADVMHGTWDKLADLGDTVTQEDVVTAMGKAVSRGADANALASRLAEMPESPSALAGWVAAAQARLNSRKAAFDQKHEQVRDALFHVAAHGLMQEATKLPPQVDTQPLASNNTISQEGE